MSVILDTGLLFGWLNEDDAMHPECVALMDQALSGGHGALLSTDHVLDEGLTLIRNRSGRRDLAEAFASLLEDAPDHPVKRLPTGADVIAEAQTLFLRHWKRGLSFTDCTLLAHARRTQATIATLDRGFDGLAPVLRSG